jgi:hypothetical protein
VYLASFLDRKVRASEKKLIILLVGGRLSANVADDFRANAKKDS